MDLRLGQRLVVAESPVGGPAVGGYSHSLNFSNIKSDVDYLRKKELVFRRHIDWRFMYSF